MPAWAATRRASPRSSAPQQRPCDALAGAVPEQHREADHRLAARGRAARRRPRSRVRRSWRPRSGAAACAHRADAPPNAGRRPLAPARAGNVDLVRACSTRPNETRSEAIASSRGDAHGGAGRSWLDRAGAAGGAGRHRAAPEVEADHQLLADDAGEGDVRGVRQARGARRRARALRAGPRSPASKRSRSRSSRACARRKIARGQGDRRRRSRPPPAH